MFTHNRFLGAALVLSMAVAIQMSARPARAESAAEETGYVGKVAR